MQQVDVMVTNIGQLVTISGPNRPRIGSEMKELGILENVAIAIDKGNIIAIDQQQEIQKSYHAKHTIYAGGCLVTPGFVDPHTHPIFAATRENEFAMRIRGSTYQEIAKAGGGIRNSARRLQQTDKETLKELAYKRIMRFLQLGTTTIEAKSGYGLSTDSEIKSLEILQELSQKVPLDIVPTFLGAHEVPDDYRDRREDYINLLISEMIPLIAEKKLAKYCDVFCEDHVFNIEESKRILEAGIKFGLLPKLHAEELAYTGGSELAAQIHATSADHLVAIADKGIEEMKKAGTIAVLLPATTFFLGSSRYAPGRKMIDSGMAVALATDFNPGSCMNQNMQLVLTIAAMHLKMLPEESLVATTINSACAIGKQEQVGSLMPGKQADIIIWQAKNYSYLPYHFGDNLIRMVLKKGKIVAEFSEWL